LRDQAEIRIDDPERTSGNKTRSGKKAFRGKRGENFASRDFWEPDYFERKTLVIRNHSTLTKILMANESSRTLLYRWFIRLGTVFYEVIALYRDGKSVHFAASELKMADSMVSYLDDEDFVTKPK